MYYFEGKRQNIFFLITKTIFKLTRPNAYKLNVFILAKQRLQLFIYFICCQHFILYRTTFSTSFVVTQLQLNTFLKINTITPPTSHITHIIFFYHSILLHCLKYKIYKYLYVFTLKFAGSGQHIELLGAIDCRLVVEQHCALSSTTYVKS